jgi:RNA polymerase sigma-70 factor (ECF subfamily)
MTNDTKQDTYRAAEAHLGRLMVRYVGGDKPAFEEIYKLTSPRLFGYLYRLTRDSGRAEDLVQITFAKLHRARDRYEEGAPVMPWLFTIARNAFRDEVRGLRARTEGVTHDGELPEGAATAPSASLETRQELHHALQQVPAKQREAIVLTKLLGFSVAEAASMGETTTNSLKIRVHRGLKGLRDYAWA